MSKPPDWLPEALAIAQIADKLALTWEEAEWLRARVKSGKSPHRWRVILLYFKSQFRLWRRKAE